MVFSRAESMIAPAGMPDALSRLSPDVLVADLGPDGRGLDAPREVPGVALLGDVAQAGGALAEGWRGVLPRDAGAEALSAAVGAVAIGSYAGYEYMTREPTTIRGF